MILIYLLSKIIVPILAPSLSLQKISVILVRVLDWRNGYASSDLGAQSCSSSISIGLGIHRHRHVSFIIFLCGMSTDNSKGVSLRSASNSAAIVVDSRSSYELECGSVSDCFRVLCR